MHHFLLGFFGLLLAIITGCSSSSRNNDEDGDGILDDIDNCPTVSSGDQADEDNDGIGEGCESCERVSLVADIWPGQGSSFGGHQATVLNGKLYFGADDGLSGSELWSYDPAIGVERLIDIVKGPEGSAPAEVTVLDGKLYFRAEDGSGEELWVYEPGKGAARVADINEGGDSRPSHLFALNNTLYFHADDGLNGRELWLYEPANGATTLVDLNPGSKGSSPGGLIALDDAVYFGADDGIHGFELWSYHPSTGAILVADVNPFGRGLADFTGLGLDLGWNVVALDGQLYFSANDGVHGVEPWTYSPASGALALGDIALGGDFSSPYEFTVLNGSLYFWAHDGNNNHSLWEYDRDMGLSQAFLYARTDSWSARQLTAFNEMLYFSQDSVAYGDELWRYDPANPLAGATLVADIYPGRISSQPRGLRVLDNMLHFTALSSTALSSIHSHRSWLYDPADGISMLGEISASFFTAFVFLDGNWYFAADDDLHGSELWRYNPSCDQ